MAVLRFKPPLGELGVTYDDHLRLVGRRVVDFLLVLIELFSLGRTAEALRAIIGPKINKTQIKKKVQTAKYLRN